MDKYYTLVTDIEKDLNTEHKQTLDQFKSQGHIDGKMNSPDGDFTGLSPAENIIKATYQSYISRFKAQTDQIIRNQEADFQHIGSDLNELRQNPSIVKEKVDQLTANANRSRLDEKNIHQTNITQIYQDPKYINAKENFQTHDNSYKNLAEKLNRNLPVIPQFWYYPILFLMGVSEFYLTYSAFSGFGETVLGTTIMALSAGIIFPVLAHYMGKILRQNKRNTQNIIALVVLLVIAVALAVFLARQVVNFGIQTQNITNENEANTTFIMRILIVLGIFAAGCLISFFNHEPSINFLDTYRLRLKAKKEFDKVETMVNNEFNAEQRRYQTKLTEIENALQSAISKENSLLSTLTSSFKEAERALNKTKDYQSHMLKTINSWYIVVVNEYRSKNLQSRVDRRYPKSWGNEPEDLKF